jgi:hypothetical protein
MLNRRIPLIAAVLATLVACDSDTSGPDSGDEAITFTLDGSTRTLRGTPGSALLTQSFVAARADSVGGIVAVGYESAGSSSGNLFVLQAPRSTGTFSCGDDFAASPCHGRYITGIAGTSTTQFDRFFNVTSGSVTWTQIGPDRLKGTFTLSLRALDGRPNAAMEITNGVIDVPYVADPNASGELGCLLKVAGVAGMSC